METNAKKLTYWQQHFKRCKARKLAKIRGPLPYMWQGSGSKSGSQKRVRLGLLCGACAVGFNTRKLYEGACIKAELDQTITTIDTP